MKLYLVLEGGSDDNRDLTVAAENPGEAVAHWQAYYETESDEYPERVFAIEPNGKAGPLSWHGAGAGGALIAKITTNLESGELKWPSASRK
jgi:hypothetical protein